MAASSTSSTSPTPVEPKGEPYSRTAPPAPPEADPIAPEEDKEEEKKPASKARRPRTVSLFYRPELENPPMAEEATVGFSKITGTGEAENMTLHQGLNRNIPAELWDHVKDLDYAQRLLGLGALKVVTPEDIEKMNRYQAAEEAGTTTIADLSARDAIEAIDTTTDETVLRQWLSREQRTPVRAALKRRITGIENGEI